MEVSLASAFVLVRSVRASRGFAVDSGSAFAVARFAGGFLWSATLQDSGSQAIESAAWAHQAIAEHAFEQVVLGRGISVTGP